VNIARDIAIQKLCIVFVLYFATTIYVKLSKVTCVSNGVMIIFLFYDGYKKVDS
jgi:hypothetical protein